MANLMGPASSTRCRRHGWSYVVPDGEPHHGVRGTARHFRCETVGACIKPGTLVALRDVRVTEAAYGPIMLLCCWAKGYKEPAVFGHEYGLSRRGVSLVCQTISD